MTISVKTGRSNITVEVPDCFSPEHAERWVDLAIDYVKEIDKQLAQPPLVTYRDNLGGTSHGEFPEPRGIPLNFT